MTTDSPEARLEAARRHLGAVPVMKELFAQGAALLDGPAQARAAQLNAWAARTEALEHALVQALIEHFTAEEIDALTRFQASPEGRAIMRKLGPYTATVLARIQPLVEAIGREISER